MIFQDYICKLNNSLLDADRAIVVRIFDIFKYIIKNEGTVILCGNGGSFANSLHIAGDYHKTFAKYKASFHAIGENFCSISAIANDSCFENAITFTLNSLIKKSVPTCVVFLSGSGNSINLINAHKLVKNNAKNDSYLKTISLSAYGGGSISEITDIALSFDIKDMEIAEDIQLVVFHYLKQELIKVFPVNEEDYRKYNKRTLNGEVT